MMKAEPILAPFADDEKMLFYISALVCNKKLRRNKFVLRTFRSLDEELSVELIKLM